MALIYGHGFATLGTPDLDGAVDYYSEVCRLVVTEERQDEVFLTGGSRHHWFRLVRRDEPGVIRLGYQAVSGDAIQEIRSRLDKAGISVQPGGTMADDRVTGGLRFRDPFGLEIEVYEQMVDIPVMAGSSDAGLARLLHSVVGVGDDIDPAEQFYAENLGFLRSDRIEDLVVFMRSGDLYHHSLGMSRGVSGTLDHVCILVDDINDVMRLRTHAMSHDALRSDVLRHAASGSISIYLHSEQTNTGVEFCTGHQQITDDSYRGRLMKASPSTANIWSSGYPSKRTVGAGGGADNAPPADAVSQRR